ALWQFKNLIKCTISGSDPLHDYNNYGCCWGCCKIHDDCYSAAMNNPDCFPIFDNPYTEIYSYTCEGTTVTCSECDSSCLSPLLFEWVCASARRL
ncbi:PA21B Phospholipase, partial [Polyodon spathula]|nr:PA21B Phospholipase [Polyodon spathula]